MNLSAYRAVPASLCGLSKPMSAKRIPQYSLSRAYCRKILASVAISRSVLTRLASKCRCMILLMNAEVSCAQWSATAVRSCRNKISKPGDSSPEMNFESAAEKICETISGEQASTLPPAPTRATPAAKRQRRQAHPTRRSRARRLGKVPARFSQPPGRRRRHSLVLLFEPHCSLWLRVREIRPQMNEPHTEDSEIRSRVHVVPELMKLLSGVRD